MSILLDVAYLIVALLATPFILARMAFSARWRAGFAQRLGAVLRRQGAQPCIWIHAVSVGELTAARTFVEMIAAEHPDWDLRFSTTTNTGQALARTRYGAERCFYFPLDISAIVGRVFRRMRPDAIILLELEIWPNFLRMARRLGVPVLVINGRMREERVATYRRLRALFAPAFKARGNLFCVQNETYRDRFLRAGFPEERLRVTGTMKYDAVSTEAPAAALERIRRALGLTPDERVWVAGCTWPGEEEACLKVHRRLLEIDPALRLIIAPRHIERAGDVARTIEREGFACRRRSEEASAAPPDAVRLLDTVGELGYVYSLATFAFVGKSLMSRGGHNVLEPAAMGVVPVFGLHVDNFQEEAQLLLAAQAAEQVADEAGLADALVRLLRDAALRREMGARGRRALLEQRGASRRHVDILRETLTSCQLF